MNDSGWIDVRERLPECDPVTLSSGRVLLGRFDENSSIQTAGSYWKGTGKPAWEGGPVLLPRWFSDHAGIDKPTHWQSLPAGPAR